MSNSTIKKIDTHQHFWQLERGDYTWLTPKLTELYQDFLPNDLSPLLTKNQVTQTILVQAATSLEETEFMLKLAEKNSFIAGVVGWIDMTSKQALKQLTTFENNNYFKGIRPMLQDIKNPDWILNGSFDPIFKYLTEKNLTFDALINDIHLNNILSIARKYPDLKIVINHCAKPAISSGKTELWKKQISEFKNYKNVMIKLSGLVTEAKKGIVRKNDLQRYVHYIIEVFGINRIMWGSDWPVVNLNGDYSFWVKLSEEILAEYDINVREKIYAKNAKHFYDLQH